MEEEAVVFAPRRPRGPTTPDASRPEIERAACREMEEEAVVFAPRRPRGPTTPDAGWPEIECAACSARGARAWDNHPRRWFRRPVSGSCAPPRRPPPAPPSP